MSNARHNNMLSDVCSVTKQLSIACQVTWLAQQAPRIHACCRWFTMNDAVLHDSANRCILHAKAAIALARLSHRNSAILSVHLSVHHTGGSVKNSAS